MPDTPSAQVMLAVDQGTSATKAVLIDGNGTITERTSVPITQHHPQPGWVEQDPEEILTSVHACVRSLRARYDGPIAAAGLSTQRESAVVWERSSGRAISPVLGWQDRRTTALARSLAGDGVADEVRAISGLPLDPMFSALKIGAILDVADPDRRRARAGELAVGTVDAWLLWRLSGEHRIEAGNASRTQLLDLETGEWSPVLLDLFDIPLACLPTVRASDAAAQCTLGDAPLHAVLGDSHAALFGHGANAAGDVKVTYGTGSSLMGLSDGVVTGPGLVGTIAWSRERGDARGIRRAFEGNVLATGATVQWLAQLLATTPAELAMLAASVPHSGGVDLVPAFAGLAAPWWDDTAIAVIAGLQLGTGRAELARAAFDSIALQIEDVLAAAERELSIEVPTILVDGGPSANDWLLQLQADTSRRAVVRHESSDLSALGAGLLAADAVGSPIAASTASTTFLPERSDADEVRHTRWAEAIDRACGRTGTAPATTIATDRPTAKEQR